LRELARHAHSLKSTSQSFGLQRTGRLAQSLQLAGDHGDLIAVDQLLPTLDEVAAVECREFEALCAEFAVSSR
jgi:HPt (histidine-containing phosphotransfer) domain-containing protein